MHSNDVTPQVFSIQPQQSGFAVQSPGMAPGVSRLRHWLNPSYDRKCRKKIIELCPLYRLYNILLKTGNHLLLRFYKAQVPLTFFEVYEAARSSLAHSSDALAGDYYRQIIMAPANALKLVIAGLPNAASVIIQRMLQFPFSLRCVKRVVTLQATNNSSSYKRIVTASFTHPQQVRFNEKRLHLFIFGKATVYE